jgi:ElaB/YqjD/DUF883 family membrane-anchored ribosome-binding protein
MSISEAIRAWLLGPVLEKQKHTEELLMAISADVKAKLDELQATIDDLVTDVASAFQALKDQIAAGQDTAATIAALDVQISKLKALDLTAEAELPPTPPAP